MNCKLLFWYRFFRCLFRDRICVDSYFFYLENATYIHTYVCNCYLHVIVNQIHYESEKKTSEETGTGGLFFRLLLTRCCVFFLFRALGKSQDKLGNHLFFVPLWKLVYGFDLELFFSSKSPEETAAWWSNTAKLVVTVNRLLWYCTFFWFVPHIRFATNKLLFVYRGCILL